jgi:hypothetical protein
MWYKKEGGSVIKALETDKISSLAVICSNRSLSYKLPPKMNSLILQSEAGLSKDIIPIASLEHEDNNSGKIANTDYYIFRILQFDGKDHVLKTAKVDRMMKWINLLAYVSAYFSVFLCYPTFYFISFIDVP